MISSYMWLALVYILFFAGCAPGFAPMGGAMDPNSFMVIILIIIIVFGVYLYNKKDGKQDKDELLKRVEDIEKELKEIKDKL